MSKRNAKLGSALGAVRCDPSIMGGAPCFEGTRIPVDVVWWFLLTGSGWKDIAREYPTLSRADFTVAKRLLDEARKSLDAQRQIQALARVARVR